MIEPQGMNPDSDRVAMLSDLNVLRVAMVSDLKFMASVLDAKIDRVAAEVVRIGTELREIRPIVMTTKDDVSRILQAIEAFAGKAQAYDQKAYSHGDILTEHDQRLRDHERRLKRLESN